MKTVHHILWIDYIRGIGIFGVIVFHTNFLPFIQVTNPLLMSWALPVFLFTGGWLLKDKPFSRVHLQSTVRRLVIPFFTSGIMSCAGWIVLRTIYPDKMIYQPIEQEIMKWLTGRNAFFNSPLWFIPTYIFASGFMQMIAVSWFHMPQLLRWIITVTMIFIGFRLTEPYAYPIFSYDLVVLFVGLMMLGSIASNVRLPRIFNRPVIDGTVFILFCIFALTNGYVDMFQRQFRNEYMFILSAILGSYSISRVCIRVLPHIHFVSRIIRKFGTSSMQLLIWHWPIMQWLTYILYKFGLLTVTAETYLKTSFVINPRVPYALVLQILYACFYSGVSIFIILYVTMLVRYLKRNAVH